MKYLDENEFDIVCNFDGGKRDSSTSFAYIIQRQGAIISQDFGKCEVETSN